MAVSDAQKRAIARYNKKNVRTKSISFFPKDKKLYEFLTTREGSMSGYLKSLIAKDMISQGLDPDVEGEKPVYKTAENN